MDVDGEVDHSKLHFHVHQTDLPRGHDSLSLEYDGEELDFGVTKSGDWYVLDREGNKVTPVETLIFPFGLGEQLGCHDTDNSTTGSGGHNRRSHVRMINDISSKEESVLGRSDTN